jgi:protein TonB
VKRTTVVLSAVIHAGVAMSLMGAAQQKNKRKAISVAVADAKKKGEPPKPPPAPPRAVAHHAPKVVASLPRPSAAPAPARAPAPRAAVATALSMSNDDAPGGIALAPRAGGPGAGAPSPAPARVASALSSARTRRAREALGEGSASPEPGGGEAGEAPCAEEPSKPEPVFKQEIEYTAAARSEGIEGKIKLKLTVAADGSVAAVEVLTSLEPGMDAAAQAAARLWRFRPAMRCGRPVAGGTYILVRRFELGD